MVSKGSCTAKVYILKRDYEINRLLKQAIITMEQLKERKDSLEKLLEELDNELDDVGEGGGDVGGGDSFLSSKPVIISDFDIIRQKLGQGTKELSNKELAYIADNIHMFSEEELESVPHTYMSGTNRFLTNQTMEIMFVLKIVSKMHNIELKTLLPVFLKPYNKCFFPTLVKKKECTQKRRHGCLTCSGHMMLEDQTNIEEYVERLTKKGKVE